MTSRCEVMTFDDFLTLDIEIGEVRSTDEVNAMNLAILELDPFQNSEASADSLNAFYSE